MPSTIESRLNNSTGALWLAAEINGATNPFVAVTFEVAQGQRFKFNGISTEIALQEAGVDVMQLVIRGFPGTKVLPTDSFQSFINRPNLDSVYSSTPQFDVTQRFVRVADFFPFRDVQPEIGPYTFICGLVGGHVFANNVLATMTLYGEVINENADEFPYKFR